METENKPLKEKAHLSFVLNPFNPAETNEEYHPYLGEGECALAPWHTGDHAMVNKPIWKYIDESSFI